MGVFGSGGIDPIIADFCPGGGPPGQDRAATPQKTTHGLRQNSDDAEKYRIPISSVSCLGNTADP